MSSICVPYSIDPIERQQWNYVFNNWNIDTIYLVGDISANTDTWSSHALLRTKTVQLIESVSEVSECLILITPLASSIIQGEMNLESFTHANNCCYVFGDNNNTIFENVTYEHKIYIDTQNELYNWCAANIVFYDKMVKNGN